MCQIPNDPLFYIVVDSFPTFVFTIRRAIAIILLIFCGYFRRTALSGHSNWTRAHQPIGPSLNPSPAPMTTARVGATGCLTWIMCWFFFVPLLLFAIDLFIIQGEFLCKNTKNILLLLLSIAGEGWFLFKQFAKAALA